MSSKLVNPFLCFQLCNLRRQTEIGHNANLRKHGLNMKYITKSGSKGQSAHEGKLTNNKIIHISSRSIKQHSDSLKVVGIQQSGRLSSVQRWQGCRVGEKGGEGKISNISIYIALAEPLSTHFTHCHRQPISPISLTYRVASRLGLAASQLDLAAAQLVVLSVGFRSPRELGKFYIYRA